LAEASEILLEEQKTKLLPTEMEGSTFTVSNLGVFVVEFNSIINQPNSAILSVGAIVEKPVVKNGQIVVGNTMMLSLHATTVLLTGRLEHCFTNIETIH
jgi:pyruvate/2-oxoglutarate dehydrogenase complex dihydrolipoamide acyltransferase (E2) component